jgi:hypothetical protein
VGQENVAYGEHAPQEDAMQVRWCPLCRSAQWQEIDDDLRGDADWHDVAEEYGFRVEAVAEHWEHMSFSAAPTARAAAPALRRARPTSRPVADGKPGALPGEDGQGPRWEEVDALIAAILGEQLGPLPGLD